MTRETVLALIAEAWSNGFGAAKSGCPYYHESAARDVYLADVEFDASCTDCKAMKVLTKTIEECVSDLGSDDPQLHPPSISLVTEWFDATSKKKEASNDGL